LLEDWIKLLGWKSFYDDSVRKTGEQTTLSRRMDKTEEKRRWRESLGLQVAGGSWLCLLCVHLGVYGLARPDHIISDLWTQS
jgi:hypothetical protein